MPTIAGITCLEPIGRGGSGVVLRARQDTLGRVIAVKLLADAGGDEQAFARFSRECHALGAVGVHPHIATVYDCGLTAEGDGYLAMELLTGGSLAERLAAGPLAWPEAAELGVELAGALETAHRVGVLHRDVKPENVLFDGLGTPKLLDFGIATVPGVSITMANAVSLTLAHAAPEVLAGTPATIRSDVYSLASTVYAALRGEAAFAREEGETLVPLLARIASQPVAGLSAYGVPAPVATVVEAALAKDPDARPASAEAFGVRLAAALEQSGGPRLTPPVLTPVTDGTAPPQLPPPVTAGEGTLVGARLAGLASPHGADPALAAPTRRTRSAKVWPAAVAVLAVLAVGTTAYALTRPDADLGSPGSGTPVTSASTGPVTSAQPSTPAASSAAAPAAPRPGTAAFGGASGGVVPTGVQVMLAWSKGSGAGVVDQYQLVATRMSGSNPVGEAIRTTVTGTSTTIEVPLLAPGKAWYRWQVRAVGPGGTSAWTDLSARLEDLVGAPITDGVAGARAIGLRTTVRVKPPETAGSRGRVVKQSLPPGTYAQGSALTLVTYGRG